MSPFIAEFIGTAIVVLLGNGVVANVLLSRTKGNQSGWIVITTGWAFAVFIGIFCSQAASGAHLNPAVTLALAVSGTFPWARVAPYLLAQMLGGFLGGSLVLAFYLQHFRATEDTALKLACFCTAPNIRNLPQSFFCEMLGTFMLVFPVFMVTPVSAKMQLISGVGAASEITVGLGTLGALPVALVVFSLGLSLGGTTGYAINPARDLGPRLAHALLAVPGKGSSDWNYSWVPVLGPIAGGLLAALTFYLVRT